MDDLISRQDALEMGFSHGMNEDGKLYVPYSEVINNIRQLPSMPSAERVGKWITKPNIYGVVYCSECDFELHINNTNYCPNCGAKMEG